MEDVDRVWIRATGANTCLLHAGDRHLWMLLRVHRMMLGGGALLAARECSERDLMAAVEAAEYFGLPELAKAIHGVSVLAFADPDQFDSLIASLTDEYRQAAPSGSVIVTAFHKKFRAAPGDFAPT
jgi:hypothetical protein